MTKTLLALGFGYSADATARHAMARGWRVVGTTRSTDKADRLRKAGVAPILFEGTTHSSALADAIRAADAIVVSIAPDEDGDPVLRHHAENFRPETWVGYLSTVGVYGDHGGAWVDETTPPKPTSQRSIWRLRAEEEWREVAARVGFPCDLFRLAGIYGPGRNQFRKLKRGDARALVKPGQVFNRIHVADIASAVWAGLNGPGPAGRTRLFNVSDDEPAPPQDVLWYAADIAGFSRPDPVDFETADLSPMARSFYGECKRVRNDRLKRTFGFRFCFPTYREGLGVLWASGAADS